MGADLFEARPDLVGSRSDEIAGFSLADVCINGPEDELVRTEHAQPALFSLGYALWDELSRVAPEPAAAAGHSLGEYTALAAAGVFSYDVALGVVAERGRAMAEAADANPSSMAAVLGGDAETVEKVCASRRAEGGELWVANYNSPGQVVVAGSIADIDWIVENARDQGLRRVMPLSVAGAFHTPLMEGASERLRRALARTDPAPGRFPVYANLTAQPVLGAAVVDSLVSQVVSPVRFAESLQNMAVDGIDTFVHVGPGDVTAGLVKRTVEDATVLTVSELGDIAEVGERLTTM